MGILSRAVLASIGTATLTTTMLMAVPAAAAPAETNPPRRRQDPAVTATVC